MMAVPSRPAGPKTDLGAVRRVRDALTALMSSALRPIIIGGAIGLSTGVVLALVLPREYSAQTSFFPETREPTLAGASGFAGGLAGQLGLNLGGDATSSPRYYVELLQSRAILSPVVSTEVVLSGRRAETIGEILTGQSSLDPAGVDRAIRKLKKMIASHVQAEPRIIYLSVTSRDRELSAAIANRLVDLLKLSDVEMRQSEAKDRRAFLEQRVGDARKALDESEHAMAAFLDANRALTPPRVRYEEMRLQRDIDLRSGLFTTLSQQLETARIDEINQRGHLTVIDAAVPPLRPDPRAYEMLGIVGLFLGAAIGAAPMVLSRLSQAAEAL